MNKNILITGASRGLGYEMAKFFLKSGYNLYVIDKIDNKNFFSVFHDGNIKYFQIDLANTDSIKDFLDKYIKNNIIKVNVLILNAAPRIFKRFEDFHIDELEKLTSASFLSSLIILNSVYKQMKNDNFGRIFIISSKSGLKGYSKGSVYCSYKSAWITFHEAFSREINKNYNISINTICPDSFSTNLNVKIKGYQKIIDRILTIIENNMEIKKSEIHFPSRLITKIEFLKIFILKLIKTIK